MTKQQQQQYFLSCTKLRKKERKRKKENIRVGCLLVQAMQIKYIVVRKGLCSEMSLQQF